MGQLQFGRRRQPRVEWDRPCSLAPRYRYRVVLTAKDDEDAGVEIWNRADDPAQSRWIRLRPGAARG
jgi:hypothetical protein